LKCIDILFRKIYVVLAKQKILIIMKTIALSLMLMPIVMFSQNLINNSGFENGLDYWYLDSTTNYQTFFIETQNTFVGSKSLRIELQDGDTASFGQVVPVNVGSKYNVGYSVKTEMVENYMISFIEFVQNGFENVFSLFMGVEGMTNNWESRIGRLNCPNESENLIYLFVFYGPGKIYLDEIFVYEDIEDDYSNFTVNLNQQINPLKDFFQSNGIDPGNQYTPNMLNNFQELGINYVRTHDFAIAFDHSTIVGIADYSYDPFNPSAYYFHVSDSLAANIYNAGGKLFYRFGQSYNPEPMYIQPPPDMEKWADVCVQIIKHYNEGWNNGYYYNLDYFEIWNEPDLPEFWSGTTQEYIELYRTTSQKIKDYNPDLKVGGPALANPFNQSFINEFLDSVQTYNLPLDFFSYHMYYLPNPYHFKTTNDYIRTKLDSYGLNNVEIINTEWNTGHFNPNDYWANEYSLNDAQNAAQVVSTINYMQETDIDMFFRYAFRNYWFGLIDNDANLTYSGLSYSAYRKLFNNGTRIEAQGSDTIGKSIVATKSDDEIHILVADNASNAVGYNISFQGTAPGVNYNYSIYRIDENNLYQICEQDAFNSEYPEISVEAIPPFTDHIVITPLVDINQNAANGNNVNLAPNPAKNFTVLSFGGLCETIEIKLTDINGKHILDNKYMNVSKLKIDLTDFSIGLYTLSYNTGEMHGSLKLVIE
jgi:xylan 1,4-beta-xylosidase